VACRPRRTGSWPKPRRRARQHSPSRQEFVAATIVALAALIPDFACLAAAIFGAFGDMAKRLVVVFAHRLLCVRALTARGAPP
jgi:hypothetical protein